MSGWMASSRCLRRMPFTRSPRAGPYSATQASKLSRTFAALTEALDRRRGKRQQRITVEHVHVHAGGQAIVGSVTAGVPGQQKLADQSNATRELADEPSIPLRGRDAVRETVPVANGSRKAPV